MNITYSATCNFSCPVDAEGTRVFVAGVAQDHEATAGHRVTVWDSPTSQIPRSLWTDQPVPDRRPVEVLAVREPMRVEVAA